MNELPTAREDDGLEGPWGSVRPAWDLETRAPLQITALRDRSQLGACRTLASLRHPSLPAFLHAAEEPAALRLISAGPDDEATGLSSLSGPALARAAAGLASALALLHRHGITHGGVAAGSVRVSGERAVLWGAGCFERCEPRDDVAALAGLLRSSGVEARFDPAHDDAETFAAQFAPSHAHPRAPGAPASLQTFTLELTLRARPAELWRFVSNTERVNRAAGVSPATGTVERDEKGRARVRGRATQLGFGLEWIEHPYEFVAGERLGVLREYDKGPLQWLRSTVTLTPLEGGGTALVQTLEAQARSWLFVPVIAAEVGLRLRSALERVYLRIDEHLADVATDAFEAPEPLGDAAETALHGHLEALAKRGADAPAVAALEKAVRTLAAQDLARMRPLELAWETGLEDGAVIDTFFHAAAVGLLVPAWDVVCGGCRAAATQAPSLDGMGDVIRCEACGLDVPVDAFESLELVFRPDPKVREADLRSYCLASPAHMPHVAARQVLEPGERLTLCLQLSPGAWTLSSPDGLDVALEIAPPGAAPEAAEVSLASPAGWVGLSGAQRLTLCNDTDRPQRVRVEAAQRRLTVFTAAHARVHPLFAEVFGDLSRFLGKADV